MTTTTLQFDPATHTYSDEFGEVPSVTQVLKRSGIVDTRWFNPEARTRGSYVAQATELHDRGILDYGDLDVALRPYVDAWGRYLRDSRADIFGIETRVFCPHYRFAGTLDRLANINGSETIIDIKTGAAPAWHALQLAGYAECFETPLLRIGVVLKPNGRYTVHEYRSTEDRTHFLAALTVAGWISKHGGNNADRHDRDPG